MSKYSVGDKVLRRGNLKTSWSYTIVAIKGHLWWRKALLAHKRNDDMMIEENTYNLYPYPDTSVIDLVSLDHNANTDTANPQSGLKAKI